MKHLKWTRLPVFFVVLTSSVVSWAQDCKTFVPISRDLTGYVCGGTLDPGFMNHNANIAKARAFIWEAYKKKLNAVISVRAHTKEGEGGEETYILSGNDQHYQIQWKWVYHDRDRLNGRLLPVRTGEATAVSMVRRTPQEPLFVKGRKIPDGQNVRAEKYELEFHDKEGKTIGSF